MVFIYVLMESSFRICFQFDAFKYFYQPVLNSYRYQFSLLELCFILHRVSEKVFKSPVFMVHIIRFSVELSVSVRRHRSDGQFRSVLRTVFGKWGFAASQLYGQLINWLINFGIFGFEPIRVPNWEFLIDWVINEIEVDFVLIGG